LTDEQVSQKTYQVEKIYHGTPSGIDNTVVAYQRPIYFRKEEPLTFLDIQTPISLLIADSGKKGDTISAVEEVRQKWINDPEYYNSIFHSIDEISTKAFEIIQADNTGD
jgi:mevalonate kinase